MANWKQLASRFAPLMYFHNEEQYYPIDPNRFISESTLWKREGDMLTVLATPGALGDSWVSDYDSVPSPDRRPKSWGDRPRSGQYQLWLRHESNKPIGNPPNAKLNAPAYYFCRPWGDGDLITYWFFFGYSDTGLGLYHQGDWECVSLFVQQRELKRLWLCSHGTHIERGLGDVQVINDGTGSRPVGYFAKNRHATYFSKGTHGWRGDVTGDDFLWDARPSLQSLVKQTWCDYSGGWGARGHDTWSTGPAGPWDEKRTRLEDSL